MRVVSVNVGLPREVQWRGKTVTTSIFKAPVPGLVRVNRFNVEGDQQADLTAHGGADKAVYAYPSEHYAFWRDELPGVALSGGAFGENLTMEGLLEDTVNIGDRLRMGTAEFVVTQPRMPCLKLAIRFGRPDIVKQFLLSGRTGFYLSVSREGEVTAGDSVTVTARDDAGITVADIVGLHRAGGGNRELLRRASELPALPEDWRDRFRKRLRDADA